MNHPLQRQSLIEQTASHLREGFQSGRWAGKLPGVLLLTEELMVSKGVVRAALKVLEGEGWIEDCGAGRSRRIVTERKFSRRLLRVGIMLYEPFEDEDGHAVKILLGIKHGIEVAGHVCVFASRSLAQLNENLSSISRVVKATDADAWIVFAGSDVVLKWFSDQRFPVYALGGRFQNLPLACSSTHMAPAIESAVNALMDHGHRRIVVLGPTVLRKPKPTSSYEKFLSLLEARGITGTDYHLPHFEETPEGLESCLNALFHITPPTALLVQHSTYCAAVLSFLARRGLQVPGDVSVVCVHADPVFRLSHSSLAHFSMPVKEHISSITRWVNGVANGCPTQCQVRFDAAYVPGGSVGPVKK